MWRPVNKHEEAAKRLNDIGYQIRGCIFEVYKHLGPGLLESIYEEAMVIELESRGLKVAQQVPVLVYYKEKPLKKRQRLDLLVEDEVVVELKSVAQLHPQHFKQITSQLKSTEKRFGYLVNFNCGFMEDGRDLRARCITTNYNSYFYRLQSAPEYEAQRFCLFHGSRAASRPHKGHS